MRIDNNPYDKLQCDVDCQYGSITYCDQCYNSITYNITRNKNYLLATIPGGAWSFLYKNKSYPFFIKSSKVDSFINGIIEVLCLYAC